MSKPAPPTDRTTNWSAYNAALRQRGSLLVWFDPEAEWLAVLRGRRGCPATFSDSAIQACLTLETLFGLPLRQTEGMVASLLKLAGLHWPVPDFEPRSAGARRVQPSRSPIARARGRCTCWSCSAGIKAAGEGEWSTRKHGAWRPRSWRKVHLGIDAQTVEVRAIEIAGSRIGDGPMLPELLAQIPPEELIGQVTADGAHDTRPCHAAIAARQASAVIPTRRNERPWKETTPGAQARNEVLRATRRLGRTIWRNWSGHHRQSRIKARMRCLKLLGERLMAGDFDRQTAELHIRAAFLNRFTRLGTPETQRVA